ncbi:MAG: polymer-forming cytoskeletal protein [Patescibacteria group bacterium]
MFSKENKAEKFKDAETIIGASIKVKGNFHGQGDIVVEGSVEGSLKTGADIFVGEKAKVNASIESENSVINGEISGNIKTKNYLAIGATAKISGDIQYGEISIEKGAIIIGQLAKLSEEHKRNEKNKSEEREGLNEK